MAWELSGFRIPAFLPIFLLIAAGLSPWQLIKRIFPPIRAIKFFIFPFAIVRANDKIKY